MAVGIENIQITEDLSSIPNYDCGTGPNRIVYVQVGIAFADSNTINSVDIGGNAMTPTSSTQLDPYGWAGIRTFVLLNPPEGSQTVVVSTGDDSVAQIIIATLTGADTSSVGTPNSNNGDSDSASVTLAQTASGNLLIAGVTNGTDTATMTGTGGSTVQAVNPNAFWFKFGLATKPTNGTGTLALATLNTTDGWAIQGFEVRIAPEPPEDSYLKQQNGRLILQQNGRGILI